VESLTIIVNVLITDKYGQLRS